MSLLNFDPARSPEGNNSVSKGGKKPFKLILGIGALVAVIGLGSTLAANININSGPIEFGQGVAQTTACSGDTPIYVTPQPTFYNVPSLNSTATTSTDSYVGDPIVTSHGNGYYYFGVPNQADLSPGLLVTGVGIKPNTYVDEIFGNDSYSSGYKMVLLSDEPDSNFVLGENVTFTGGGHFVMSSIEVTDIPESCNGAEFTIKAYGASGELSNLVAGACYNWNGTSGWDGRSSVVSYDAGNQNSTLINHTDEAAISVENIENGFILHLGGTGVNQGCFPPATTSINSITIESSGVTGGLDGVVFDSTHIGFPEDYSVDPSTDLPVVCSAGVCNSQYSRIDHLGVPYTVAFRLELSGLADPDKTWRIVPVVDGVDDRPSYGYIQYFNGVYGLLITTFDQEGQSIPVEFQQPIIFSTGGVLPLAVLELARGSLSWNYSTEARYSY